MLLLNASITLKLLWLADKLSSSESQPPLCCSLFPFSMASCLVWSHLWLPAFSVHEIVDTASALLSLLEHSAALLADFYCHWLGFGPPLQWVAGVRHVARISPGPSCVEQVSSICVLIIWDRVRMLLQDLTTCTDWYHSHLKGQRQHQSCQVFWQPIHDLCKCMRSSQPHHRCRELCLGPEEGGHNGGLYQNSDSTTRVLVVSRFWNYSALDIIKRRSMKSYHMMVFHMLDLTLVQCIGGRWGRCRNRHEDEMLKMANIKIKY